MSTAFLFSETSTDVLLSLVLGCVSNNRRNANVFSRFYLLFSISITQCLTYNPIGYEVECFSYKMVIGLIAGIFINEHRVSIFLLLNLFHHPISVSVE